MAPMSTIAHSIERIRAFATARGWTKSRLAREAGMIDTTLRDFHKDSWNPTAETIRRIEAIIPDDFSLDNKEGLLLNVSRKKSDIDADFLLLRRLADLLNDTGLGEIEYTVGEAKLRVVAKSTASPNNVMVDGTSPSATRNQTAEIRNEDDPAETSDADHPGVVVSPMVGVVYTADDPEAPPFVKVGDEVEEGQTLLLIEAMKVFNQIKAPRSGRIVRIMVSNGTPVEFGEPLMIIE